ncbi:hypothetical protein M413DRAFT_184044 [Hebeloma cylindrosporum]|uniref:Uncharacterized protein n=1 Tax=Hebeloma cylindrosporum TaxID=76867 RepID=A0A0C2XQA4_HEBCY|nr:hypothetical protein M413DRAFT_184044 [Hebeloma cylindrosporum h7]
MKRQGIYIWKNGDLNFHGDSTCVPSWVGTGRLVRRRRFRQETKPLRCDIRGRSGYFRGQKSQWGGGRSISRMRYRLSFTDPAQHGAVWIAALSLVLKVQKRLKTISLLSLSSQRDDIAEIILQIPATSAMGGY